MSARTVLITGCTSGIGRASALAFHDHEWQVYATARDPADVQDLADRGCETVRLDVTDPEQVSDAVDRVVESEGRLDCLVNNAGYGQLGPIEDVPTDQVHAQFDVNVYGPHRLTRAVLPHMRDRGSGTIVNLSSAAGRVPVPGMGVYCGSKFAVEAMSDALRQEVDDYGVDVVVVEPGPVDSGFRDRVEDELGGLDRSGAYEAYYEFIEDTEAVGGAGALAGVSPGEVAGTVLHAADVPDPAPRYQVGSLADAAEYARFLPDSLRDRLFGLALKYLG